MLETHTESYKRGIRVLELIRANSLTTPALMILLYTLATMESGYLVTYDIKVIMEALGMKRTSYFNGIKSLRDSKIITKVAKNQYAIDVESILSYKVIN